MRVRFREFVPERFSFHQDPVLVLEDFWGQEEIAYFQEAMSRSEWKTLSELPRASRTFRNCGNWRQAEFGEAERSVLLERIAMSCIFDYVNSFPNIKKRHVGFNYYSYGVGDCLSIHDDTEGYAEGPERRRVYRRVALATYLHTEWQHNWGGELILYQRERNDEHKQGLGVLQCIPPDPGTLVLFTVPRVHRVCRVDPLAEHHKRLSISGWFSSEH